MGEESGPDPVEPPPDQAREDLALKHLQGYKPRSCPAKSKKWPKIQKVAIKVV
jgi:hypothetical protein